MITLYRPSGYDSPRASCYTGRSIDDKPLNVENGSTFKEIDTGRVFRYDKENNIWIEQEGATPVQPTKPEQAKTVDLAMATGNQTITPDEGKTLSSVTVNKPTTMIPANIKTGVDIGGIVGTYEGVSVTEPYMEETYDAQGDLTNVVLHGYMKIRKYAFYYCKKLTLTSLPSGLTRIDDYAFYYCTNLALTSLPSGLTRIGYSAFRNCTNLALTSLPSGIVGIPNSVFQNCTGLTSITFEGTPASIASDVFDGCTNLTEIKVPWAEGAVANAPWGATNATITYNYTA